VEFCCWDIRPFHMIAGKGFIDLAQELINVGAIHCRVPVECVLPNPTTISRKCKEIATTLRQDVLRQISGIMSDINVGMTTDVWTDDNLIITCHFITPEYKLKSRVLTMAYQCSPQKKQKLLVSMHGFDAVVMNWVTDQGSNIIAVFTRYCCLDCQDHHALNPTKLRDSVPEIAETAKALVKFVKQMGLVSQLTKTVRQMSDTRFSTVFLGVNQECVELQEKLDSRGGRAEELMTYPSSPRCPAQRELEGDQYPTLNLVVLWHERLKRHCKPVGTDSRHQAIIRERQKVKIELVHMLAIFLWPEFCQLCMLSRTETEDVHQDTRRRIACFTADGEPSSEPSAKRRTTIVAEFEEWVNIPLNEIGDALQQYISCNHTMKDDRDMLGWCKSHSGSFPLLARHLRVISIPATSRSSQRNFNATGLTVDKRRTALKPSTVDAILFLHNSD
uniref:HAT C-terminal dimerisation domain-containing protein n=1 Tax=Lepisosteus oculatus TaxID=7918 RepID=W5MVB0_LEPOC